jgi:hypothetical protein
MKKPSDRPTFIAKDASGNQTYVRAGRLEVPRKLFPFESRRKGRDDDDWRGCNHCGRYVPDDCQRVEWRGKPDQPPLFMHQYCFLKTHKRKYAEWLYGADVFAGDGWIALEKLRDS